MAGISEDKAMAAKRQGMGLARHLGVERGSERYNRVVYGTKRAAGWYPSKEGSLRKALSGNTKRY